LSHRDAALSSTRQRQAMSSADTARPLALSAELTDVLPAVPHASREEVCFVNDTACTARLSAHRALLCTAVPARAA
jgi:hypothetical protein